MKNSTTPTKSGGRHGFYRCSVKSVFYIKRQLVLALFGILFIEASSAQPQITGKVATKRFTSFQQVQSDDYKGTGSYQTSVSENYTVYLLQNAQVTEQNVRSKFLELVRTQPELASDCLEKTVLIEGGKVQKLCTNEKGEFKSTAFPADQTIFVIYSVHPFIYKKIISKKNGNNLGTRTLRM